MLGLSGTSGAPTVPAGTALGGGRSASGWGGILYSQDEEHQAGCLLWQAAPASGGCRVFPGLLVMVRSHCWTPLVPGDEWGCLWPDGEGERFQVGCLVEVGVGLPIDPSLLLPGWPGVVGGTPLPPGAGMSPLGLPSVSRLGSGSTRPGSPFVGWGVVRHPVAVLFQSWVPNQFAFLFHLSEFSVGYPSSYCQGLQLHLVERSREGLTCAILS